VKDAIGYALYIAQRGGKHVDAKPLRGFGGAGILEIVEDHAGDTYRAVYTVRLAGRIYALHAFRKKSKTGIKTPKPEIELIKSRLKRNTPDGLRFRRE
jgi:phage-related protein